MPRRFITRADVKNDARDGVLLIGPSDVITAAAEEIAQRRGITIKRREASEAASEATEPTKTDSHTAILSAFGRNRPGILANLTQTLADNQVDIVDLSQNLTGGYFSLLLILNIEATTTGLKALQDKLKERAQGFEVVLRHDHAFE